ncbi:methyltransferase domain-containing protein [Flavobacteriaceae bacterium R38]|nr:methyltransferase domain-containing protein [Flavobacteriaceae bacterium R38]
MSSLKKYLKKTWLGKHIKKTIYKKLKKEKPFPGSAKYWEERYLSDRDSGPGSYGRLANFKAEILNSFVQDNAVKTVLELGCGDGHQLSLATYPHYIGFDVSEEAIRLCKNKFKEDSNKEFYLSQDEDKKNSQAELALSLDVIYHLIEDHVFEGYMQRLCDSASKYIIIYASNYDDDSIDAHVKCRKFTNWMGAHVPEKWKLKECIKNRYPYDGADPKNTSMSDFYIYKSATSF